VAVREHVTYIDALIGRNGSIVELACRAHLASAKETLLRSTSGEYTVARKSAGRAAVGANA